MPQPQQSQIQAASEAYTTAQGNTGSLTHWFRPGIKRTSLWILVGFVTAEPWRELAICFLWFPSILFENNFIEVWFTYLKCILVSVQFNYYISRFTKLHNHHYNQGLKHLHNHSKILLNLKYAQPRSSHRGSVINKSDKELWGCQFDPWPRSLGQGSGVAESCGVGCRCGSGPM